MSADKQDKIIELLDELLKWQRFESMQKAREILSDLLKTDNEKLIYSNSDGHRTSREIAEIVGVSHVTVTNYWKKWTKYGVVKEQGTRGGGTRYQGIFSLSDFGIDIPKPTVERSEPV